MSLTNRVTPLGDVVAAPGRGTLMGNRGVLHTPDGTVVRGWAHRAWISCTLSWRGRRLPLLEPGHHTQLFFLDEAVALAAGHRPCALCRRPAFRAYREAARLDLLAPALDSRLHAERLDGGTRRLHQRPWSALPDGAMAALDGVPVVVRGTSVVPWLPANAWGAARARPTTGDAEVITPPTSLAALVGGYPITPR